MPGEGIFAQCVEESGQSSSSQLDIAPRAGMAVVHFPTTCLACNCVPDCRTMHESEAAVDTKFIVQQFVWPVPIDPDTASHEDVRALWATLLGSQSWEDGSAQSPSTTGDTGGGVAPDLRSDSP